MNENITRNHALPMRTKMKLILDTGQLMMENGAGSKRIVRDMLRAAAYLGIYWKDTQIHIAYSTIMLNVDDGKENHTMFRKCYRHVVNMEVILQVSKLSWEALSHNYSYEEYSDCLEAIRKKSRTRMYAEPLVMLCIGLASGAFCMQFGGTWSEAAYTLLAAVMGAIVRFELGKMEINPYLCIAASAFVSTLTAYGTEFLPGDHTSWLPMMACALTLIPGVPLINGVDDFMNNYLTSGLTRITHTILIMLAMTFGLSAAVGLTHVPSFTEASIAPETLYVAQAIAACMSAIGFSIMFNVPKHYIPLACLGAVVSVDTRNILMVVYGLGMSSATFAGAAAFSILCFATSRYLHAPTFIITIPSVIPLIPGILLYRFLFAVIQIQDLDVTEFMTAMQTGVEATLVLLGISVGATLPDVIGHQFIEKRKQKRLLRLLREKGGKEAQYKDAADLDRASGRG